MKEFAITSTDHEWAVIWAGCDGRAVCRCGSRREAVDICAALNESGLAAKWYKRARTALGMPR